MAAEEMRYRLGDIANDAFVGTIHSYANKLCLANGISTFDSIDNEKFDEILYKARAIERDRLPEIDHLLIDEAQDLTDKEYNLLEYLPYNNVFYCGDLRQSIYGFKGASDKFLSDMLDNLDYTNYYLVDNYRNPPNIINFANSFLNGIEGRTPNAIAVKKKDGVLKKTGFMLALDDLEMDGNWGSWFILTRTNREIDLVQRILDRNEIPNVTFKTGDLDGIDALDSILKQNSVKVLTAHAAKGQETQNVIVTGMLAYNEEERKIAYVAATRAKNSLYWCPKIPAAVAKRYETKADMVSFLRPEEKDSDVIMF